MGIFSFVKNAGKKIFGGDDEVKEQQAQAHADAVAREAMALQRKRKREAAIAKSITDLGLQVEELKVSCDGDAACLEGKVTDQATREKVVLVAGNVDGIAEVDDRLVVTNPEPEAKFYTVVKGDTLSKIAKEQYGKASLYPKIFEANRPMLEDPDKIYPGQVLRIPPQS